MKKILVLILTVAMLATSVAAIADGMQGGPMGGQPPMMGGNGPQNGQQPPEKPSGDNQGQQPPEKPSGDNQGQQPPEKPSGDNQGQQPPEKPSGDNQGQQPPEKPSEAPETPTGEKPADAPAEPEDLTGDRPEMPSGAQGQQPSEKPSGDQGQQPPEKPSGDQGQQAPQMGDQRQRPGMGGPGMVDFDAMVTKGVISQETRDNIKAYMDEHKPKGAPADGQAPSDSQTPPEKPEGAEGGLLADLLNAGIITQAEYDAMIAAQTAA